jgi:hypothetical protein
MDMKRLLVLAVATAVLVPAGLGAQSRDRDRSDRGRRYDRDGERGGRLSGVIADCERRTDEFQRALRRALDRSRLDGTRREDRLNEDASRLERAINRLRESWNEDHDAERSRRHVRVAISAGRDINRTLSRHALRGGIRAEWDDLRSELNRLADAFGEPAIRWERWDRD